MPTTSGGLPYPNEDDPVADGAQAIRLLAEAVGHIEAGVRTCPVPAVNTSYTAAVTFARPYPTPPVVVANPQVASPQTVDAVAYSITTTGFLIAYRRTAGVDFDASWIAYGSA